MKNQMPKTIEDYICLLTEGKEKFGNLEVYFVYDEDKTSNPDEHCAIGDTVIYTPCTTTSLYPVKSNVTSSEEKSRLLFVASGTEPRML